MSVILILGAADDSVNLLTKYLHRRNIPHIHYIKASQINLAIELDDHNNRNAVIYDAVFGKLTQRDISVFLHKPLSLLGRETSSGHDFIRQEHYATLIALSSLVPRVINKPCRTGWQYGSAIKSIIPSNYILSEMISTDFDEFIKFANETDHKQIHIQDLVTSRKLATNVGNNHQWQSTLREFDTKNPKRAIKSDHQNYIVHIVIGTSSIELLNETDVDSDSRHYKEFIEALVGKMNSLGLNFFIMITTYIRQEFYFVKLITDPPIALYEDIMDKVFSLLIDELHDDLH